jgi:hypothetical protein
VIYASADRDPESFKTYFESMPWAAIPYPERQRFEHIGSEFEVDVLPCLVVLSSTGKLITTKGRKHLFEMGGDSLAYWKGRI